MKTMADRETVIYDIERCICHVPDACKDCSKYGGDNAIRCMEELLADALSLLKAQEPKTVKEMLVVGGHLMGKCPRCCKILTVQDHPIACGFCGQAVKWQ